MKHLQVLLAVIVLTGASGVLQAARPEAAPEEDSFTLYTPSLPGDTFSCSAVNVSHKTLEMTFTILDVNGVPFQVAGNPTPPLSTSPAAVGELGPIRASAPPSEGYCKVEVFGTGDRNDIRVVLTTSLTRTIPGTTVPVFVFRTVQGY